MPGLVRRLQILNETGKGLALSCHWGGISLEALLSSKGLKRSQAKRGDETRGAVLRERSRTAQ